MTDQDPAGPPAGTATAPAPAKRPPGRPSKLDADTLDILLACIRRGMPYDLACRSAGIAKSTFMRWKIRAEEAEDRAEKEEKPIRGDREYLDFWDQLKDAVADRVFIRLDRIEQAGARGSWQADAWLLERCHPDLYGRQRLEVSGPEGAPVKTQEIHTIVYQETPRSD